MNTKTDFNFSFSRNKKRTKILLILLISVLILSACGASAPSVTQTPAFTFTPVPPTVTFAPSPTPTLQLPVSLGTAYPSPSNKISVDNADQVVELARYGKERGSLNDARYSPDGKTIVMTTSLGIYFYDSTTLEEKSRIETGFQINTFVISPDNKILAVAYHDDTAVHFLNTDDGKPVGVTEGKINPVVGLAFSSNGDFLASGSADGSINLWQISDGKLISTFSGQSGWVRFLAFSPDDNILYSAGSNEVIAYQVSDQKILTTYKESFNFSLSNDGNTVAVGSGVEGYFLTTVTILTTSDGKSVWNIPFEMTTAAPVDFALSPDAHYVAALSDYTTRAGEDNIDIKVYKIGENSEPKVFKSPPLGSVRAISLSYSPDGQTLLLTGSNFMTMWDVATGDLLKSVETNTGWVGSPSLSPDGQTRALVDDTFKSLGIRFVNLIDGSSSYISSDSLKSTPIIRYSPDGGFLAADVFLKMSFLPVSGSGDIKSFDYTVKGFETTPSQMVYSPDGQLIAVRDTTLQDIYIFSIDTGEQVHKIARDEKGCERGVVDICDGDYGNIAFSPDGDYFMVGMGALRLFSVNTWTEVNSYADSASFSGINFAFNRSAFSSDSSLFAYSKTDKSIQLREFPSMEPVLIFPAQSDTPVAMTFSPDETILATGADNGTIRLWSVSDGSLLSEIKGHNANISMLAFLPDGKTLLSISADATIRLWGVKP